MRRARSRLVMSSYAPVDRVEVEVVLQPGEVVVVLLVEVGDEAVDALAVRVQLARSRYGHGA